MSTRRSHPVRCWRRPGILSTGGAVLAMASLLPSAARAQEAQASPAATLMANFTILLYSFGGLLVVFVALLVWEFLDRRSEGPGQPDVRKGSPYQPASGPEPAPQEEDPFQALLKKSAPPKDDSLTTMFRPGAGAPEAPPSGSVGYGARIPQSRDSLGSPAPAPGGRAGRDEEEEELSPFQRLAQIGSEDREKGPAPPKPPAPPQARPPRIEVSGTQAPKPEGGGDWSSLLGKAQGEEAPAAPPRVPPAKPAAGGSEDPWKKLLGQTAGESAPGGAASAGGDSGDPWQALLRKTSGEGAGPAKPPAPPSETPRPKPISLDFKGPGSLAPPPKTEDESDS